MPIQPYFPEPMTVPGNIAEAKHRTRVSFVRRVVAWHFVTCLSTACGVLWLPLVMPLWSSAALTLGCLTALTFVRRAFDGGTMDNVLSTLVLVPALFGLSQTLAELQTEGWPIVVFAPVCTGVALYALFCGNDFSYVGQFVIVLVFTGLFLLGARLLGLMTPIETWSGAAVGTVFLFYYVYDLSMLVKRRRQHETAAAVADLYRDLLNFVTYLVRVVLHWRRFRFI